MLDKQNLGARLGCVLGWFEQGCHLITSDASNRTWKWTVVSVTRNHGHGASDRLDRAATSTLAFPLEQC